MKKWYEKVIVPRILNSVMSSVKFEKIRQIVLAETFGIVLELGVGPGHNFQFYKKISKLYALEPSKELIDIAKVRADSLNFPIEFLYTGAEHIPLPNNSIDTVVSTWTLCSVANPEEVLSEIARVLRPQGIFIFVDHGASPHPVLHFLQKTFTPITKHFAGNCHLDRHIEKLITDAGFDIKQNHHPNEHFKPLVYNSQGVAKKNRAIKQILTSPTAGKDI